MPKGYYKNTKILIKGRLGKKHSKETKQKLRKAHLGKKHSEETKLKMSLIHKGKPNLKLKGKKLSEEHKRKLSESHKGHKISEETKKKISKSRRGEKHHFYGKKFSEEHRRKISKSNKGILGNNWKGGITPKNMMIRGSIEFRLWREAVFARDNWTCQRCLIKGGYLHSHHIRNFAEKKDLRFAIDNGITFCRDCHKEFHRKYGYKNNTKEQIILLAINL